MTALGLGSAGTWRQAQESTYRWMGASQRSRLNEASGISFCPYHTFRQMGQTSYQARVRIHASQLIVLLSFHEQNGERALCLLLLIWKRKSDGGLFPLWRWPFVLEHFYAQADHHGGKSAM